MTAVHPGSPGHPVQPRSSVTGVGAGGDPYTGPITRSGETSRSTEKTPRTIRVRMAAVIAVLAFVIGLGAAMLLGPILGPGPGGPGGPGTPGGPNGTTTSQQGSAPTQN